MATVDTMNEVDTVTATETVGTVETLETAETKGTAGSPSTLGEAIARHGVDVDAHLDRQTRIPVLAGLQAQGDVLVAPRPRRKPAETPVLPDGLAVVRGEFGGNTHTLLAEGDVRFDAEPGEEGLDLGVLTVAEGAVAYLAHPEHAYSGIAPGTYVLRRQREVATARTLPPVPGAGAPGAAPAEAPRERTPFRWVRD